MSDKKGHVCIFFLRTVLLQFSFLIVMSSAFGQGGKDGIKNYRIIDDRPDQLILDVESYLSGRLGRPKLGVTLYNGVCSQGGGLRYFNIYSDDGRQLPYGYTSLSPGYNTTRFIIRVKDRAPSQFQSTCLALGACYQTGDGCLSGDSEFISLNKTWAREGTGSLNPPNVPYQPSKRPQVQPAGKPDLVIHEIKWDPHSLAVPAGTTIKFNITVVNGGNAPTNRGIRVCVHGFSHSGRCKVITGGLIPGYGKPISIDYKVLGRDVNEGIVISIDPENTIDEINENNNDNRASPIDIKVVAR